MKKTRKITVYLGWDGAYVMSRKRLYKLRDGSCYFLGTKCKARYQCVDMGTDGGVLFGALGLKKYEVVKLRIEVEL